MSGIEAIMNLAPVIPVLVIEDVAHARPIAEALVRGGLPVLEVTLRTASALDASRAPTSSATPRAPSQPRPCGVSGVGSTRRIWSAWRKNQLSSA